MPVHTAHFTPRQRLGCKVIAGFAAFSCLQGIQAQSPTVAIAQDSLTVTARADGYAGAGALAEVRVDGALLRTLEVKGSNFADYDVPISAPLRKGSRVSIRFTNDRFVQGEDRNLYVEKITYGGVSVAGAADGVLYDAGATWEEANDGRLVATRQSSMLWNGALHFDWPEAEAEAGDGVGAAGAAPTPAVLSVSAKPFNQNSFWYKPIDAGAPVNEDNAAYVKTLQEDLAANGQATVNTAGYAPPVYVVDSATPRRKVSHNLCTGPVSDPVWVGNQWSQQFDEVPVPDQAQPAVGSDGEIVIWSPSTDEVWEMWQFRRDGGSLSACWGGKIEDASKSDGVFPRPFGVTASGLSLLGGTVRIDELRSGRIDHAIAIGVNRPRAGVYSWPANRTDGTWSSDAAIPEGTRFRIDPSLDVDKLNISPIAKIIAKAGQTYGFVVRDNTTGPVVVYAEDSGPYVRAGKPNPYTEMFGAEQHTWMIGFPWDRMQALPLDHGKP